MFMRPTDPDTHPLAAPPKLPSSLRLHLLAIAVGGGLALAIGEPAAAIAADVWTNFMFPAFEKMFELAGLKLC
ncbi:MAG: hypothetical protein AB7G15_05730 [Alphaproteobacteria bacterium]